jgi:hypothetical protein
MQRHSWDVVGELTCDVYGGRLLGRMDHAGPASILIPAYNAQE